jgi:hypothetical protein
MWALLVDIEAHFQSPDTDFCISPPLRPSASAAEVWIRFFFVFRPADVRIPSNTLCFCRFSSTRIHYAAWFLTKIQLF